MDELEEKPDSLRIKKLKELIDEMSMIVDQPNEPNHEEPALEIAVMPEEKPKF